MAPRPFKKGQRFSGEELIRACNEGLPEDLGVSPTVINGWAKSGLLDRHKDPSTGHVSYSFLDLVKAKVAASLMASKKSTGTGNERIDKAIRTAVERLGRLLAKVDRASGENGRPKLSDITIFTQGVRVVFETDQYQMDGATGQLLFRFENQANSVPEEVGIGWVAAG